MDSVHSQAHTTLADKCFLVSAFTPAHAAGDRTYNRKYKSDAPQGIRIPQSRAPRVQEDDPRYISSALVCAEAASLWLYSGETLTEKVRLIVGTLWPATTNLQDICPLYCRRAL